MDVLQARQQADKTPLTSLEGKVAGIYGPDTTPKGGYKTRVMLSTPQGIDAPYLTLFTANPVNLKKGAEYSFRAKITPQGPRGLLVNIFNGKIGFTAYEDVTFNEVGTTHAGSDQSQPAYTPPQEAHQAYQAPQAQEPVYQAPTQAPSGDKMPAVMARCAKATAIYVNELTTNYGYTPEQAIALAANAPSWWPLFWFGEKGLS